MELQFDKEMDAILRKARDTRGVPVGNDPPKHLDADVIAAFAENAVPPKARLLYMEHFGDCDSCRRMLSSTILMNTEAVAATASSVVSEPVATVPWYLKIFRTPNLALAMGALVLTFGGVLGYLVLQNRNDVNSASVAKVADKQPEHTYSGSEQAANTTTAANSANASAANAATNMSAAANAPASNPIPSMSGPSPETEEPSLSGRLDVPGTGSADTRSKNGATDGVAPDAAKPAAAAPPPPVTLQPADRDEKKAGEDKMKDESTKEVMSKTAANDDAYREGASLARKTGPNRSSIAGPRNVQQQMENNTQNAVGNGGMAVPTRSAGGKTFENRDGVWYDRSYNGQATNNYRRGTDEYKKLDGGLRKISDSIGGTVVLVWKTKAYRIQ